MCSFEVKYINLVWRARCHPELLNNTFWSLWRLFTDNSLIAGHWGYVTSVHLHVHHVAEEKLQVWSSSKEMAPPAYMCSSLVASFATVLCHGFPLILGCCVPDTADAYVSSQPAALCLRSCSCHLSGGIARVINLGNRQMEESAVKEALSSSRWTL